MLELHRVEGLTHREIARLLGIKPATSRKRLERAIEALERREIQSEARLGRHTQLLAWRSSLIRRALPKEGRDG